LPYFSSSASTKGSFCSRLNCIVFHEYLYSFKARNQ
jgi:hypothetical protein